MMPDVAGLLPLAPLIAFILLIVFDRMKKWLSVFNGGNDVQK